jgi:hypothetical protein
MLCTSRPQRHPLKNKGFPQKKPKIHTTVHFQSTGLEPYIQGVVGAWLRAIGWGEIYESTSELSGSRTWSFAPRPRCIRFLSRVVDKGVVTVL